MYAGVKLDHLFQLTQVEVIGQEEKGEVGSCGTSGKMKSRKSTVGKYVREKNEKEARGLTAAWDAGHRGKGSRLR